MATRIIATVVCFALLAGCGSSERFDDKLDRMRDDVDRRFEAEMAEKRKVVCQPARDMLPATSIEQLVEAYKLAYAAGDITAIEQMAYLEEDDFADAETREAVMLIGLATGTAGKSTVTETQLRDLSDEEQSLFPKNTPFAELEFSTRYNDDSGSSTRSVRIAKINGHPMFYFAVPQYPDEE